MKAKMFNDRCPYCNSENIDYVDSDEDSIKYICRECGDDFLVLMNNKVTTRNNKLIME